MQKKSRIFGFTVSSLKWIYLLYSFYGWRHCKVIFTQKFVLENKKNIFLFIKSLEGIVLFFKLKSRRHRDIFPWQSNPLQKQEKATFRIIFKIVIYTITKTFDFNLKHTIIQVVCSGWLQFHWKYIFGQ